MNLSSYFFNIYSNCWVCRGSSVYWTGNARNSHNLGYYLITIVVFLFRPKKFRYDELRRVNISYVFEKAYEWANI